MTEDYQQRCRHCCPGDLYPKSAQSMSQDFPFFSLQTQVVNIHQLLTDLYITKNKRGNYCWFYMDKSRLKRNQWSKIYGRIVTSALSRIELNVICLADSRKKNGRKRNGPNKIIVKRGEEV